MKNHSKKLIIAIGFVSLFSGLSAQKQRIDSLVIKNGSQGAGKVLISDANGNATWGTATASSNTSDSTTASNGLTLSGKDVRLGGILSSATTVFLGANNLTFNGTGALNKYSGSTLFTSIFNIGRLTNELALSVAPAGDAYMLAQPNSLGVGTAAAFPLDLYTNNAKRMTITSTGNVGIANIVPNARLYVNQTATGERPMIVNQVGSGSGFLSNTSLDLTQFSSTTNGSAVGHHFTTKNTAGTTREGVFGINPNIYSGNGAIGIFTGSGSNLLSINLADGSYATLPGATLTAAGVWTNSSDRRLKKDIVPTKYGLDAVMKMRPVDYKMKKNDDAQVGFIAQEMRDVVPEVVSGKEGDLSKGENLGISYGNLVAVLTKAVQEQQAQIQEQQAQIEALKKEVAALKLRK